MEKRVHVAAALEQWAAEHSDQLSPETLGEVSKIADMIRSSSADRMIGDVDQTFERQIDQLFAPDRANRARTLIQVVSQWAAKHQASERLDPTTTEKPSGEPAPVEPSPAETAQVETTPAVVAPVATAPVVVAPVETATAAAAAANEQDPLTDAFLRSEMADDSAHLYGPKRRWRTIVGSLLAITLIAAAAVAGWWWFTQRDDTVEGASTTDAVSDPTAVPAVDETTNDPAPTPTIAAVPAAAPTPTPEPAPETPTFWADTAPILNSGSSDILASTYSVSPSNRAVLTGHTAAITGIAISDDGRVLTSGADRRLVDWGADVTLADPDVVNVPSPLTVLERTADQRLLIGDSAGTLTIIDLVNETEALPIEVHDVAISAAAELIDGRLAVASADGDVAVFAIDAPDERLNLAHPTEVTAVAALADGRVATAAADSDIYIWDTADGASPALITTLNSPATALIELSDGRLAMASVDGELQVVSVQEDPAGVVTTELTEFQGHSGAIRALFEITFADGMMALASGGDDTTIRVWDLATQAQLLVLEGHGDIISAIDALPDGRLVTTSGDGTGRVWDLSVPANRPVIAPHDLTLSAIRAWNNDQIVTGGIDGKVVLASTAVDSEPLLLTQHTATIVGLDVLENGEIISLDASSLLRISQPNGDPAQLVEIGLTPGATSLDVSASLGIVTGHADGTVRRHDFTEELASVEAHGSGVNDVAVLTNGLVVSAGQDMTVRVTDFDNPDQVRVFDLHTAPVDVVIELPDGRIASAGSDGLYVYTVDGLAQDHVRLNGQRARTISLVALPNDRLISTGDDGRVRLWDLTQPESEPITLVDIPGVVNPHLVQAQNGLFVSGAARGYVVFTLS